MSPITLIFGIWTKIKIKNKYKKLVSKLIFANFFSSLMAIKAEIKTPSK